MLLTVNMSTPTLKIVAHIKITTSHPPLHLPASGKCCASRGNKGEAEARHPPDPRTTPILPELSSVGEGVRKHGLLTAQNKTDSPFGLTHCKGTHCRSRLEIWRQGLTFTLFRAPVCNILYSFTQSPLAPWIAMKYPLCAKCYGTNQNGGAGGSYPYSQDGILFFSNWAPLPKVQQDFKQFVH